MISGSTSLHITTYKDHEGASVGGGLTGYKCETCLSTGKPWSGLARELQFVDQVWFDGLDGYPFRNTVSS